MTKTVALIGYPLKHSVSPSMQQAAFDYYALDVRYEKWEIESHRLDAEINRLRQPSVLGANVTIPYKEKVIPLLDGLDDSAARIAAVNTIVNRNGNLVGANTDAAGFIAALQQEGGFDPRGTTAILLGAGGAARAVGFALLGSGLAHLTIANRTPQRAKALADYLVRHASPDMNIATMSWAEVGSRDMLSSYDLLVNCTSLGMKHSQFEGETPLGAESIPQHALVCDLVYNPLETALLKEARRAGARGLGGLAMLVYQGAASFRLWVNKEAPLELMFRRAKEALGER